MKITSLKTNKYLEYFADLRKLYLKTGSKFAENQLIKVASEISSYWLKFINDHSGIKSQIQKANLDPEVFEALVQLEKLKQVLPKRNISKGDIASQLVNYPNIAEYYPIIYQFKSVGSQKSRDLLALYSDVLNNLVDLREESKGGASSSQISETLDYIADLFRIYVEHHQNELYDDDKPAKIQKTKLTKKQKKTQIIRYIFKKFTEEVSTAFDSLGFTEAAKAVRTTSNGGLLNDDYIYKAVAEDPALTPGTDYVSANRMDVAGRIVKKWSAEMERQDWEDEEYAFDYLRNLVLANFSVLDDFFSQEALDKIYQEQIGQQNLDSFLDESIPVNKVKLPLIILNLTFDPSAWRDLFLYTTVTAVLRHLVQKV